MRTHKTVLERYWEKVGDPEVNGCRLWTGGLGGNPYGSLWDGTYRANGGPRMVTATRIGHELRVGPIPEGLHVLHTCDTPPCHNDAHWFLGTLADNNRDRQAKGRTVLPGLSGERHGRATLTDAQVAEIRERYATCDVKQSELALEFGVGQQQISRLVRGESRRHDHRSPSSS